MSFTFAARTLLELGKELISSDEVALYELIKNAVDAQSRRVEIIVNVHLKSSDYREAVAQVVEEKRLHSDVVNFVRRALVDAESPDSVALLKEICRASSTEKSTDDDCPAVVLMSSRKIDDVEKYRQDAGGERIVSVRFRFLEKRAVRLESQTVVIDHAAADVLLDTTQGYVFGKLWQQALKQWRDGAAAAFKRFTREVSELDLKDVAYLLRFRLREEGQSLSEYLEWLFGEYLRGRVESDVDWMHASFMELDGNENVESNIEGAYEGASKRVAELFHSVRVRPRRVGAPSRYRLGDLYKSAIGSNIRAVISPDCDLVVRKGKTKVGRVLTMGGVLSAFDEEGAAADNLVLFEDRAYSVLWRPKDLETFPIEGAASLDGGEGFGFVGTLRPLYAQAMQRRALAELSRIGLPVAPALGINASAVAWIRTRHAGDGFKKVVSSAGRATIIPRREGRVEGHRVLLARRFVYELVDGLGRIGQEDMEEEDATALGRVLREEKKFCEGVLRKGGSTKGRGIFGICFVVGEKPRTKGDAAWLQIVLKISGDALEELRGIDPLVAAMDVGEGGE